MPIARTLIACSLVLLFIAPSWGRGRRARHRRGPGIIATIGPTSSDVPTLRRMIRSGMSVARINLAHNNARSTKLVVDKIRRASALEGRRVKLLFDLPGGKVRTGKVVGDPVRITAGQNFEIHAGHRGVTTRRKASVSGSLIAKHTQVGDRLLLNDGRVVLRVDAVRGNKLSTKVIKGGELRGRTGVAIQGKELPFPAMLARDRRKMKIAVENGADWIALSFAQSPRNVQAARRALNKLNAPKKIELVAKIESGRGVAQLSAIAKEADQIMIARGDLGVAVGQKSLPAVQRQIAEVLRRDQVPFITATNFMSKMLRSSSPSAANIADVRRAKRQRPSFLMLNETAISPYPVDTVKALKRALR